MNAGVETFASLREIVASLGNDVASVDGPLDRRVECFRSLGSLGRGAFSFCQNPEAMTPAVASSEAAGLLVTPQAGLAYKSGGPTLIFVRNPRLSFVKVLAAFVRPPPDGIHPTAVIDDSAKVDASASIGPNVVIGSGCSVGPRTVFHAGVVLYPNSRVGARVILHAGVIIGGDGLGFERDEEGWRKFPHIGGVVIEDDVEIGANSCVDRGALEDTIIERGAKLDNLVHVAHNCRVGAHAVLTAQVMLAGSVTVGSNAWLSPGARVLNKIKIGAGATIGMGANVMGDVAPGTTVVAPAARAPMGKR